MEERKVEVQHIQIYMSIHVNASFVIFFTLPNISMVLMISIRCIDIQTRKEQVHMDITKMVIIDIFTISDKTLNQTMNITDMYDSDNQSRLVQVLII